MVERKNRQHIPDYLSARGEGVSLSPGRRGAVGYYLNYNPYTEERLSWLEAIYVIRSQGLVRPSDHPRGWDYDSLYLYETRQVLGRSDLEDEEGDDRIGWDYEVPVDEGGRMRNSSDDNGDSSDDKEDTGGRNVGGGVVPPGSAVTDDGGVAVESGGEPPITRIRQFLPEVGGDIPESVFRGNYNQLAGYLRGRLH